MFEATPLTEVLEKHIDRIGLPQFIETIAIICDLKAEQDNSLAMAWTVAARSLDRVAETAKKEGLK